MVLLLSVLIVLITSFFCSLSEAALLSLGRTRVEILAEEGGVGRVIRDMKNNLERPIAAVLILNTVANTGGAAIAGSEYRQLFGDAQLGWFTIALTAAVLLFSEIIPKSLGVRHAERSAQVVARPLQLIIALLRPATWLVSRLSRALGVSADRNTTVSIDDLRAMARLAASSKILGREELMIIEAASRLPRVPIRHLMIHPPDIVYFSLADDSETNLVRARRSLHSRMLVSRNDLQDVLGVVSMKEVLWRIADEPEELETEGLNRILGEEMRDPLYADPDIDVSDLIQLFATKHEHLAVVRDRAGAVVGMVTLEDVVEELMGEIDDEFDRTPTAVEHRGDQHWRIGGGALWFDVQVELGIPAKESTDADLDGRVDVHDIAADRLRGRLRTGATFVVGRWRFNVTRMRRGKVVLVDAYRASNGADG